MFRWFKKKDKSKMEPDELSSWHDKSWRCDENTTVLQKQIDNAYREAVNATRQVINKKTSYQSSNMWTSITTPNSVPGITITPDTSVAVNLPLVVNGRDIMSEIDEIKAALLIVSRDVELEEKYPELKEAYDNYMEIKRGLGIAEKLYSTGEPNV